MALHTVMEGILQHYLDDSLEGSANLKEFLMSFEKYLFKLVGRGASHRRCSSRDAEAAETSSWGRQ